MGDAFVVDFVFSQICCLGRICLGWQLCGTAALHDIWTGLASMTQSEIV